MSLIAVPTSEPRRLSRPIYRIVPIALLLAVIGYWGISRLRGSSGGAEVAGTYQPVVKLDMDIKIVRSGELQAVNNIEIVSMVEGQSTVLQLVPEGAVVKKGDVLIVLDSSTIQQNIDDQTLAVQQADADVTAAQEMKTIQDSQNAANLEGDQVALALAKLDLQQYEEGAYPQALQNARTELEMSKITLKTKLDDLAGTQGLFNKGYRTSADVKKGELDVTTARNDVAKAQTAAEVLEKYTHQMDEASKKNAVAQAEAKVARTQKENASNLAQKVADLNAKTQALTQKKRKLAHQQDQLANSTIRAPADGIVVYSTSNDRNAQSALQQGSSVRERQSLMRLPDTRTMKAVVRVPEAQVGALRADKINPMRATVKIGTPARTIGASVSWISPMMDNSQRWWNPDLKEYPVELVLDETPPNMKPGVGANVDILVERLPGVTAVPLTALYVEQQQAYAFTQGADGPMPVRVQIGRTNDSFAEVKDGLAVGDQVLLLQPGQGRSLLDRAGIKIEPRATTNPSAAPKPLRAPPAAATQPVAAN